MTTATPGPAHGARAPGAADAGAHSAGTTRLRRLVTLAVGPLWVRTFRDPVREGHLRLDGLSAAERQLARFGLVTLALLLGSVLFTGLWRAGALYQLTGNHEFQFVPVTVLPLALIGLLLAWSLVCWGALAASPAVRVVVAVLYVATGSTVAISGATFGLGTWILEHGTSVMRAGFYATVGVLLVSALLHPLLRPRPRARRWVTAGLRVVVLLALLTQYGTLLWVHVTTEREGFPTPVPAVLDNSVDLTNSLLLPLVYVAAITVIDFALDVSTSVTEPVRVLPRAWLLVILGALLAIKLVRQVVLRWDQWQTELTYQPQAVVRTAVMVVLVVVVVLAATRFAPSDDYALAKERAMYGLSLLLAAPLLLSSLIVGIGLYVLTQFEWNGLIDVNDAMPYGFVGTEGLLIANVALVAFGFWLMRRSEGGFGDELGSALIVVGVWFGAQLIPSALDLGLGFSYASVDVLVTLGVLGLLVARWRRLSNGALVAMATLLTFSWLVNARGDYISFVGGLLGLPAILVVVFGVVLTLASGASFASNGSRRLPADARPLLFVGYLLLSVVLLFWITVSHEPGQDQDSLSAFYFIGLPMAAWLAGRRIVVRGAPDEASTVKVTGP